jgi:DNA-binding MarR family transcriptional regulator
MFRLDSTANYFDVKLIDSRPDSREDHGMEPRDVAPRSLRLGQPLEFLRLLWAVDHALQSASKWMAARLGVTGPQRLVIRLVGRRPGISAGAVAEILLVHPSTLTGILRRHETHRYIEIKRDPADRRRALLWLTAAGFDQDSRSSGTVEAAVRRGLARLSARDVRAAGRVLRAIAKTLAADVGAGSRAPQPARGIRKVR